MDHKRCVNFAIIRQPITLDKILEIADGGGGFLAIPDIVREAWYLAFPCDLDTAAIAHHMKSILGLDYFCKNQRSTGCLVVARSVDPTIGCSC